jgi:KDO2-lipid IV(A) lauroyltransferase
MRDDARHALSVPFTRSLLAPRHWPAWLGVGVIWLIAMLPYRVLLWLGRRLGGLVNALTPRRAGTSPRPISRCAFPSSTPPRARQAGRREPARHRPDAGGVRAGLDGPAIAASRAYPPVSKGLQHLEAAHAQGKGVLLVGGHFSHLELCARLVSQRIRISGMYRRMDSAVFEWAVLRARLRYATAMFDKDDIRGTVKYLRSGGTLWYAPDQDMRSKDSVFVPFFGVPAATISATHHLARMSGAVVIPFFHRRLPDGKGMPCVLAPRWKTSPAPMYWPTPLASTLHRADGARGAGTISVGAQALQNAP